MSVVMKRTSVALGAAAALSVALGTAAVTPAYAANGDVAKGLIIGAIGGYALNQMQHDNSRSYSTSRNYVVERPAHRRVVNEYVYQSGAASPAHQAFNSQTRRMRVSIQYQLMQRGLYNGALDGAWGPQTSNALFAFARNQNREGMLATVHGSDRLFSRLLS